MHLRRATTSDVPLLAAMNGRLLEDEAHHLKLASSALEQRMRGWLAGEYQAVLFIDAEEPVGYALFRPDEHGIYLRQFYIERGRRRQGLGRKAIEQLRHEIWPAGTQIKLEVLAGNQPALAFWRAVGFVDYAITMRSPPPAVGPFAAENAGSRLTSG